ncbi:putative clathrin assembly protein [Platanthera zijinensis]|uniref:Clathrin assembly protein n=1 Tax=Platanthera zijinensis TaxID=2320716 RepID=A0AAP0GBV8_9ASPA
MALSSIDRAIGSVKDKTNIGLAKLGSSTTLAELEIAVVKATRHDEHPADEKHVHVILALTSYSRASIAAGTRRWAVALKTLVVVHRLLAHGDPAVEEELFFAPRRVTQMPCMREFRGGGCKCSAAAQTSRIVAVALSPLVKESFQKYSDLSEIIAVFVDRFTELPISDCVRTRDLFSKLSKQFDELAGFYSWSRSARAVPSADYPQIQLITQKKLDLMDEFIGEHTLKGSRSAPDPLPPEPEEEPVLEQRKLCSIETNEAETEEGKELVEVMWPPVPPPPPPELGEVVRSLNLQAGNLAGDEADWEKALVESTGENRGKKQGMASAGGGAAEVAIFPNQRIDIVDIVQIIILPRCNITFFNDVMIIVSPLDNSSDNLKGIVRNRIERVTRPNCIISD